MGADVPPLVGREAEARGLERALDTVDAGHPRALGIWGEAGIGKSRLLVELGRRASGRGHLVMSGHAAELEREVPFALWVEALNDHIVRAGRPALAGIHAEQLADLAVALPAVTRVAGVEAAATIERHRVARAVRGLLERLAAAQGLTVLLDDVQWADPASVDVIALLLHRLPEGAVLLALAARSGRANAVENALLTAARHGSAEVLDIGPLAPQAAAALLPSSIGPQARARLYRESGGNPFYLQALAGSGAPSSAGHALGGPTGVPRAVIAALAAEIAALEPRARLLAQGAAVAGDPFDPSIAAAAAALPEAEALEALDLVLAADMVRSTARPRRFAFRHPLVRRAVYEAAGGGWKLAAHARASDLLAARGATPAERAHHVERAAHQGDLAAVGLLALAAEQTATTAPATAAGWYAAALRLLPETPEHAGRRLALLRSQGEALASAGRAGEARDVLRKVLGLLSRDSPAERVDVVVELAELEALWTQQPEEARRLLDAERAALGDVEPGLAAALTLAMAAERTEYGDHAATEALADKARAAACAAGDHVLEAQAAAKGAEAAHCRLRGEDPAALAAADAKLAAAGALVDALPDEQVARRLPMLLQLGIARLDAGDFDDAIAAVERGVALARRTRQGLLAPAFVCVRGSVFQELGRLDEAEADEEEALESALISGNIQVAYWASIELSWIAVARGEVEAALAHGQTAWEQLGTREYSEAGFTLADARLAAGDPQGALEALQAFGWVRPELWTLDRLKAVDVAVRVLVALGRVEEATAWAKRAPAEGGGRRAGIFGAIIDHAEAVALLAEGRAAEAARVALSGAAEASAGHAPLWEGCCRILAGDALAVAGKEDDARRELRRAAAAMDACGAWGRRDAALRVLRRLGERPRPSVAGRRDAHGPLASLSTREREVARLVATGQTNAQIAARLHLSESTVEKHVSRVLGKLGLSSRAAVAGVLARAGDPA